jgi:Spy/CpxP family protein refolding chaperone
MIQKRISIAILTVILSVGAASVALGAPQGEPKARTRLRENISDLYLVRLTRALELTEEQAARLYPLLTRSEKEKSALQSRMGADLQDLRRELAGTSVNEGRILDLVARIREARRAVRVKEEETEAVLEGSLTPLQRARFVVFQVEFLRSVGENLQKARGQRALIKRNP